MKIQRIQNLYSVPNQIKRNDIETPTTEPTMINKQTLPVKQSFYNYVNFQALAVRKAASVESRFFTKFKASKSGLLDFLSNTKMSPAAVFKLLCKATSDNETSNLVAKELSDNPRKGESIKAFLVDKLGGNKGGNDLFNIWYHDEEGGYRKAYTDYYNSEIWDKAQSLNEIVKHSPIIAPWAFNNKARALDVPFVLGELPKEFGTIKDYRNMIKSLTKWNQELNKNLKEEGELIKEKYAGDSMLVVTKLNELKRSATAPFELKVANTNFKVSPIIQSFSAKLTFKLENTDNNKKYILKFAPHKLRAVDKDKTKKFEENQALRPDMPYLDSMVDFYLKENRSPNAPDIKFFDYKSQAVLYRATEGKEAIIPDKYKDNLYEFTKYPKVSDIKDLGVELSDVHGGNFIVDKNGKYKLIDSGHVRYLNIFRPQVICKHITLGNLCGRELCR